MLRPRGSLARAMARGSVAEALNAEAEAAGAAHDQYAEEHWQEAVEPLNLEGFNLPKVAVFDLDETCWDHFGLDHKPPFRPPFCRCATRDAIVDSAGREVKIFPELRQVLLSLHYAGVTLAVASHDGKPDWCRQVMDCFVLDHSTSLTWGQLVPEELTFIKCSGEFWPGKTAHLRCIRENLPEGPCEFGEMLMFDDSKSVCKQASTLGAVGVRCLGGISVARLMEGLRWLTPQQGIKRKADAA